MKAAKKLSAAMQRMADGEEPVVKQDKLDRARDCAKRALALELEIDDLVRRTEELSQKLRHIRTQEMVELMEDAKLTSFSIEPVGNAPGYDIELKPFFSASIPRDPERAAAAIEHIVKVWKLPDIVKHQFSIDFGKGDAKQAKKLETLLKKGKFDFSSRVGVHASTLTAEIRRRYKAGQPLSPKELDTLGAFVGKTVELKPKKD